MIIRWGFHTIQGKAEETKNAVVLIRTLEWEGIKKWEEELGPGPWENSSGLGL